jgi:hypothetical protein
VALWRPVVTVLILLALAACGGPSTGDVQDAIERGWAETPGLMQGASDAPPGWEGGVANAAGLAANTAEAFTGGAVADVGRAVVGGVVGLAADSGLQSAKGLDQQLSMKFATDWRVSSLAVLDRREAGDGDLVVAVRYDLDADQRQGVGRVVTQGRQTLRLGRDGARWTVRSATPLDEAP